MRRLNGGFSCLLFVSENDIVNKYPQNLRTET
jgi:hypothetical protein